MTKSSLPSCFVAVDHWPQPAPEVDVYQGSTARQKSLNPTRIQGWDLFDFSSIWKLVQAVLTELLLVQILGPCCDPL